MLQCNSPGRKNQRRISALARLVAAEAEALAVGTKITLSQRMEHEKLVSRIVSDDTARSIRTKKLMAGGSIARRSRAKLSHR